MFTYKASKPEGEHVQYFCYHRTCKHLESWETEQSDVEGLVETTGT